MVELDPRAQQRVGVETVSGVITDRAIELLGMLNNAIGAEGQLGAKEAEIIFNDGNGTRTETVSNQLLKASAEDAAWKEDERVYFQATHKRVDVIQGELEGSLGNLKNELVNNITGLFETLAGKDEYNLDGQKSINELELDILNATTTEQLITAQEALEARTTQILTSEEALEEMVTIFLNSLQLNLGEGETLGDAFDSRIFNKLHDFDESYANGSSDIENEKFFYQRAYKLPGDVDGEPKPVLILNSTQEILTAMIDHRRIDHEDTFGPGTYTQEMTDRYVESQVADRLNDGSLKLSDDMIATIIERQNINDLELEGITNMSQFLEFTGLNTLIEYTGIADRKTALESLFKDDLQVTIPKYYEDNRTIFDILKGKNDDVNSGNTKDRLFTSVDSQMKNVAQGIEDLMKSGYEKIGSSNLQIAIRRNPFAGIEYLETQREQVEPRFQELIDEQIDVLASRQVTELDNLAEELIKERLAITRSDNYDADRIGEINDLVDKIDLVESMIRGYDIRDAAEIRTELKILFPSEGEIVFDSENLDYATFTRALDPEAKFTRAATALYVLEDQESSKKNTEFSGRKLPTPKADGTIPEDTMPIPPLLSPTPLSAVIAKIGDTIIQKSQALINGDKIPTTEWMVDNTNTLLKINEGLDKINGETAGSKFHEGLRSSFKNVIKEFLLASGPKKDTQDQIKDDLVKVDAFLGEGFDLNQDVLSTNLDSIKRAMGTDAADSESKINTGNNFINLAGVQPVKDYLTEQIDGLDGVNYEQEIANRQAEIEAILAKETQTQDDLDRLEALRLEIRGLRANEIALESAQEVLYGVGGDEANPQENSISNIFNNYNQRMDQIIAERGGLNGQTKTEFLTATETALGEEFKVAIKDYSDSLTDFEKDSNNDGVADIINTFRDSLDNPARDIDGDGITDIGLDLDGNGQNDLADIQGIIDKLDDLSTEITDTFGGKDASEGGIEDQSIRRLILLMFVFSMLEAGEWDSRLNDASVERYSIT